MGIVSLHHGAAASSRTILNPNLLIENEKKAINYLFGFILTYTAFVISLSSKEGYRDFNGIPLYAYVILFSLLSLVGLVSSVARKRKPNQTKD